jgi:hypothetical protein
MVKMKISNEHFERQSIGGKLDIIHDSLINLEDKIEIIEQKCGKKMFRDISSASLGGSFAVAFFLIYDKIASFKSILKIFK